MILTIAAKELRALFSSPLAWVVLAVVQLIVGYVFLVGIDRFLQLQPQLAQLPNPPGVTEIVVAPVFGLAAVVMLMVVPLLSMRLFAEERRNQTLTFLLSAPVSITDIVLGKFAGLLSFLALSAGLIAVMALSLHLGGRIDLGLLGLNVLGLLLLDATFAAIGLYLSCLTSQPVIAAIAALAVLLALWLVGLGVTEPGHVTHIISVLRHFESFARGLLDTGDVAYFVLVIAVFLWLAIRRLDRDRLAA
jgi:ABC-2 type transport system permease protein